MIRVLSFVGSCAGEASHTKQLSDRVAGAFAALAQARGEDVAYECLTGSDLHVSFCRSCNSCFKAGVCPLDETDDMGSLKEKILSADIVLFGTPVYLWEMSGVAKTVLDRISYWTHRLELAGKVGMALVTSSNNHASEVLANLTELLRFTGLAMPEGAFLLLHAAPNLSTPEESGPVVQGAAERLMAAWDDPTPFLTHEQDLVLKQLQLNARRRMARFYLTGEEPGVETRVASERNLTSYGSMAEYVRAVRAQKSGEE